MKEGKQMNSNKIGAYIYLGFWIFLIIIMILSELEIDFEELNLNPNDYARITDVDYTAVLVDEPNSQRKNCSYRKNNF